jgi:hypothetical protein
MALGRGVGAAIHRGNFNFGLLDQTNLKEWHRYDLQGSGRLTYEGGVEWASS